MCKFSEILSLANKYKATDIHLQEDEDIYFRCDRLIRVSDLIEKDFEKSTTYLFFEEILALGDYDLNEILKNKQLNYDFSINYCNQSLRIHLYFSQEKICMAIRILNKVIPSLKNDYDRKLLLPLCALKSGLIIIAGQTGSGKSYTMASLIEEINTTRNAHILTLESPIELKFENKKSLIHQRELGKDFRDMSSGVISALREDPDVIVIGEMRDVETINAALLAAETGHLVIVTMHTNSAKDSIGRIVSSFALEKSEGVRVILSQVLAGIVCQKLIRKDNEFYPVRDILLNTKAIANLIRQNKDYQIFSLQQMDENMTTFDRSLKKVKLLLNIN